MKDQAFFSIIPIQCLYYNTNIMGFLLKGTMFIFVSSTYITGMDQVFITLITLKAGMVPISVFYITLSMGASVHGIIESLRLEKTHAIAKSNH